VREARLRELAERALEAARLAGAGYADVRVLHRQVQSLSTKNAQVGAIDCHEDEGFGVRVLKNGAWGFASCAGLERDDLERVARQAVGIAAASARVHRQPVLLAPVQPVHATWRSPVEVDPFKVPLEEKLDLLFRIDRALLAEKKVRVARSSMDFSRRKQLFLSTEGACIEQEIVWSGAGTTATAVADGEIQVRSYPNSFRGQFETAGYEMVRRWDLLSHAPRVASEAAALLSADPCPAGVRTVILDGSQVGLQVHESCGHPTELDRVLGTEANYAGMSFLTRDKLGSLRYGSDLVTIRADATSPGGLGTFGYDDEGVPAQSWDLVRGGVFSGYLTSRETAATIGETSSRGCMRAEGWRNFPLIRMVNVSLMPGTWKLDDLIADTDDGIFMEVNRSWSIDQYRYNFQFGTEVGWEIRNGKRGRMLRNPTYQGITVEFWNSCDAVCDPEHWVLWGVPTCGKGQPGQTMGTGHGAAPARFRNVRVGVAYD
jgi:TldD protein